MRPVSPRPLIYMIFLALTVFLLFNVFRKWIRGAVVACYQWAITIGLLFAAVVVKFTKERPDATCYRIPIGLEVREGIPILEASL